MTKKLSLVLGILVILLSIYFVGMPKVFPCSWHMYEDELVEMNRKIEAGVDEEIAEAEFEAKKVEIQKEYDEKMASVPLWFLDVFKYGDYLESGVGGILAGTVVAGFVTLLHKKFPKVLIGLSCVLIPSLIALSIYYINNPIFCK